MSLEFELIKVRTLLPPMFPEAGRKVGMVMAFIREVGLALVAGGARLWAVNTVVAVG